MTRISIHIKKTLPKGTLEKQFDELKSKPFTEVFCNLGPKRAEMLFQKYLCKGLSSEQAWMQVYAAECDLNNEDSPKVKVTITGRAYGFIATVENDSDLPITISFDNETEPITVAAHDWVGITANSNGFSQTESIRMGRYEANYNV